jgi:glutamate synthase domain-containing protein 1
VFIEHQGGATGADLERELFIVRKLIERERAALGAAADDFYVCSLSNRTIVYKARDDAQLHRPSLPMQYMLHKCIEALG